MGDLGVIGGVSSDDVIEDLESGLKEGEEGRVATEGTGGDSVDGSVEGFRSQDFQTPEQVLDFLLDQAHLSEDDSNEDMKALARRITAATSVDELYRFSRLVVGVHDLLRGGLDAYLHARRQGNRTAVGDSVDYMNDRVRAALGRGADAERVAKGATFADATGQWLGKMGDVSGDLDLNWLITKVVVFKFEIEKALYQTSGIEF